MIPIYSPEARGRSECVFGTHQGRLPKELAAAGVADIVSANRYLREVCPPAFHMANDSARFNSPSASSSRATAAGRSLHLALTGQVAA